MAECLAERSDGFGGLVTVDTSAIAGFTNTTAGGPEVGHDLRHDVAQPDPVPVDFPVGQVVEGVPVVRLAQARQANEVADPAAVAPFREQLLDHVPDPSTRT